MDKIPGGLIVGFAPFALAIQIGRVEKNYFPEYHQSKQTPPVCIGYNDAPNCTPYTPNYAQNR